MADQKPSGTWVLLKNIPYEVTDAELSQFFNEHGLQIPPENFFIPNFSTNGSMRIVIVPGEVLTALVEWAVNKDTLGGRELRFQPMSTKREKGQ